MAAGGCRVPLLTNAIVQMSDLNDRLAAAVPTRKHARIVMDGGRGGRNNILVPRSLDSKRATNHVMGILL